jgi:hypothetical protein
MVLDLGRVRLVPVYGPGTHAVHLTTAVGIGGVMAKRVELTQMINQLRQDLSSARRR